MDDGRKTKRIKSVRDLEVYKLAFDAAMEIFEISKNFPKEETYSLTNQMRKSSRSVCVNLSEGWRRRRYKAVFINKLSDAGQEGAETQTWLEFALACKYIDRKTLQDWMKNMSIYLLCYLQWNKKQIVSVMYGSLSSSIVNHLSPIVDSSSFVVSHS